MSIINVFPVGAGGDVDFSATTLTTPNAVEGYPFFNAAGELVEGEIPVYGDDDTEPLTVTPRQTGSQVLSVAGKYMAGDITVEAVPEHWTVCEMNSSTSSSALTEVCFHFDSTASDILDKDLNDLELIIFTLYSAGKRSSYASVLWGRKPPGTTTEMETAYNVGSTPVVYSAKLENVVYKLDPDAATLTVDLSNCEGYDGFWFIGVTTYPAYWYAFMRA